MNDIKELIQNLIEKKGRFQIILIVLLCLNSIQVGINHTITSFHIYTPSFHCNDNALPKCTPTKNNLTCCDVIVNGTNCPGGFTFDEDDDRTITVEWSLVCNNEFLAPLINTLYFVGVTIGSLVCSTLCDLWGRKKLVLACMYLQAIMSLGLYFSSSLIVFAIFRVAQGFFIQGLQTCSYTLMLEYCPSRKRTAAAVLWECNWAIGLGLLGGIAYFIRDWRILTLVLLTPTALSLLYFWIIPESVSWLYANGRQQEALEIIKDIAKKNKNSQLLENCNRFSPNEKPLLEKNGSNIAGGGGLNNDNEAHNMLNSHDNESIHEQKFKVKDLLNNLIIRKHLLIVICIWFSVTLSYYGILYFLPNLPGSRHVNFLIGAAIEGAAYILAYFVLSKFGRRLPMAFYQYANGTLIVLMGLLALAEPTPALKTFLTVIALIGKGLAVSSFCSMFIYGSELFPTVCRGISLGLCGFAARCGSLLAPQLMFMVTFAPVYVPMVIMAILLTISGTATLWLPETLSTQLPNTLDETNEVWGKKNRGK
ncbi:organic cation/carnitine transporter 2-like [Condylostylus longicornis]|uniref:organic cation/carnitine transporter 2-like n=1 Tax=Condylostylus longicornis TaxID=2530218 RepID=UPI00244DF9CE|nr:organic cation/carnitine transporter 2-like [Condylostylus longicornis]XP_055383941.1 organic cation/carnitine transporter 2-like [Condylostylus longicornis]